MITPRPIAYSIDEARILRGWLEKRSPTALSLTCLVLVALIALVDHVTGEYLAISLFYLLPISIASWAGSRRLGVWFSILCSVTWGYIDFQAGIDYPHYGFEIWNTTISFAFFLITTYLVSGLRAAYQRERTLARIDGLTGALNRRCLVEELEALLRRARKEAIPLTVGYCDLDNFKVVNDSQGHAAGDAILREVVRTATETLGPGGIVGRMGGDEFVVLLPGVDAPTARARGEALLQAWRAAMARGGWPTDFSLGVVTFETIPRDADAALHEADELSRAVKARGKAGLVAAVTA